MLENLKKMNPELPLHEVTQRAFSPYGEVVSGFQLESALTWLRDESPLPETGNIYVASEPNLEGLAPKSEIEQRFFGGMESQIGYCNGRNHQLNGLEYHKGSELLVAGTDLVLLVARRQEMEDHWISSERVVGFYLPEGTAVELYATTLHYVPCTVSQEWFRSLIILPKGTNTPLPQGPEGVLRARNKWFVAHEDSEAQRARGAVAGITGPNYVLCTDGP
jgi:hypothetical protein